MTGEQTPEAGDDPSGGAADATSSQSAAPDAPPPSGPPAPDAPAPPDTKQIPPPTGAPAPVPAPARVGTPEASTPPGAEAETTAMSPARRPGQPGRVGTPLALALAGAALVIAALGLGAGWLAFHNDSQSTSTVGPTVVVTGGTGPHSTDSGSSSDLGFAGFATLNTTRVGGADPTTSAAGVALAAYPSQGDVGHPRMVSIVPASSWQAGIAAASLAAPAVRSPVLFSGPDSVPDATAQAAAALGPTGVKRADGVQALVVGKVAAPEGLERIAIKSTDPAEIADQIDKQRAKLSGVRDPEHILVVSSSAGEFAMPAAAWAARSGDPVVFADGDRVPKQTLDVLARHKDAAIYVLGPKDVISDAAMKTLAVNGRKPVRIGAKDAVDNAIEFARFSDGTFGFGISDPGHGFVIANTSLPGDAAAAAPLSAAGKPGPLLLTDDAAQPPPALQSFLLDTKPGYVDDPTRAIYNHVWLIGDSAAISPQFQADVDHLTELAKVRQGTSAGAAGPAGTTKPEAGG